MGTRSKVCLVSSVLLFIASLKVNLSIASDRISPGQSLYGNQTLISEGGLFELGFFTPGNTSQNHYVGIWYKRGSTEKKRVVWVANRETPLSGSSSSKLKLLEDGNLVLYNQSQIPVWSTNFTSNTLNSTLVVLGNDGNLVLRHGMDPFTVIWQSFDYPTDTWLPGQKFGVNQVMGLSHTLTSWKNADDPSPGNYTLEIDKNGRAQYLIMWNGRQYWISGEWNGQVFSSVPEMSFGKDLYNLSYVSSGKERYFIYNLLEETASMTFALDPSGQLRLSRWMENDQSWGFIWAQPRELCNVYNYCGAFSRCNQNDSSSCGCLPGFQLLRNWLENNYRCSRRTQLQLQCGNRTTNGEADKFFKITQTVLPLDQHPSPLGSAQLCESSCLRNCSCTAYAFNNGQCSTWNGDLLNVQPLSQGDIGGGDLYLKVSASEMDSSEGNQTTVAHSDYKDRRQLPLIIALPIALTILASSFIACWLWRRKLNRKGEKQRSQDLLLFDIASNSGISDATDSPKGEKEDVDLPLFSFASVCAATNNFSSANKLGQGGFGIVYKGELIKGQEVAVKRLSIGSGQGLQELRNETLLIAKLQHRNLVRLLGCCIEGEEKILVYEYMSNNSLDSFIFDPTKRNELDWGKRVHIIEGIAQGLLYLHQYSRVRIIHRDMKPSNILLDGEMNPKISDFGMARIFGGNNSQANTNRIVGTYGYMPPEYAMEGLFSVKSDVFSFGVLVLEIVSGRKNTGFYNAEFHNLLDHAWNLWKTEKGLELFDPVLGEPSSISKPLRYIHVALLCVQYNPDDRPTMSGVITMLSNEPMILPSPNDPAFVTGRSAMDRSSDMNRDLIHSVNGLTLSMMDAR